MFERWKRYVLKKSGRMPLSFVLTAPFVLQTVVVVGLTGWLSLTQGRKSVEELTHELSGQITARIENQILSYLDNACQLNQILADAISSDILDPDDRTALQNFFWRQIQHAEPGTTLNYANRLGEVIGIHKTLNSEFLLQQQTEATQFRWNVYQLDEQGQPIKRLESIDRMNGRFLPWYQAAQRQKSPTWSPIFQAQLVPNFLLTAAHPLFNRDGEVTDVLGISVTLSQLNKFLQNLAATTSGKAVIIERSGQIVATSNQSWPLTTTGDIQSRVQITDSRDPLLQLASQSLLNRFQDFNQIDHEDSLTVSLDGQHYLIEVTSLSARRGLDWLVIVMTPESDFTAEIQANTYRTIVLCLMALSISLLLGTITSRRTSRIISELKVAASQVAQGEFGQRLSQNGIAELDTLLVSFNRMAKQLQQSFTDLKMLNGELSESESRLKQFFEALPLGVIVHQRDRSVFYFNKTAKILLGTDVIPDISTELFSSRYQIYRAGTGKLYPTDELPALRALRGESLVIEDVEIHQIDHTVLLRVRAKPIFDRDGQVSYAVVVCEDITQDKQAQKILVEDNRLLTAQVAEKTELLHQNETMQRAILQGIPDLLVRIRADGKYLSFMSGGGVKLWQPDRNTPRMTIYDFLPPTLASQRMHYVRQAIATGECQYYEYDIEVQGVLVHEEARVLKIAEDEALVIVRDITERKRAKTTEESFLALLMATLESTAEGILSHTQAGGVLAYNQRFIQMWNISESLLTTDSLPNERLDFLAHQTVDPDGFKARVIELCKHMPEAVALELIELRDGRILERYTQPQRICDRIIGRIWTYRDVTEKQQASAALEAVNKELERLANLDGLTQVANRRYFDVYFSQEWRRMAREQQPLSLILLDVDFFKAYNDRYGHQAGDDCLKRVAQTLSQVVKRPADLVVRYGGEEFAVILPNTDLDGAIRIAQCLQKAVRQLQIVHDASGVGPFLSISLGLSCRIPSPGTASDQLIWEADKALYRAKGQGRNRYCTYEV